MAIHDVDVKPIGAGVLRRAYLLGETAKICG
jgi:hypothetical protein